MSKTIRYKKHRLDRHTLNYIHEELVKLEVENWNKYGHNDEYSRNKDVAYREVIRILSNVLNK